MDDTARLIAVAASGVALAALVLACYLAFRVRGMRRAQVAVLGDRATDLVSHAEGLERRFEALKGDVAGTEAELNKRMENAEYALDRSVSRTAVIRYDAYNEMSGHQSSSVALLDSRQTGVVLSAILHRDQARVYVKHVVEGRSELELSPEEREAIAEASARRSG